MSHNQDSYPHHYSHRQQLIQTVFLEKQTSNHCLIHDYRIRIFSNLIKHIDDDFFESLPSLQQLYVNTYYLTFVLKQLPSHAMCIRMCVYSFLEDNPLSCTPPRPSGLRFFPATIPECTVTTVPPTSTTVLPTTTKAATTAAATSTGAPAPTSSPVVQSTSSAPSPNVGDGSSQPQNPVVTSSSTAVPDATQPGPVSTPVPSTVPPPICTMGQFVNASNMCDWCSEGSYTKGDGSHTIDMCKPCPPILSTTNQTALPWTCTRNVKIQWAEDTLYWSKLVTTVMQVALTLVLGSALVLSKP